MNKFRDTEYLVCESGKVFRNGTERKCSITNKGYKAIDMWVNGKRFKYNLHRIIAETYVPNPNNKPCVNHIDGNKLNNHYTNLEWVSWKENMHHKLYVLNIDIGEKHSQSKIPNKIVSYIKKCKMKNITPPYERISKSYGVGVQHLKNIYQGRKRLLS